MSDLKVSLSPVIENVLGLRDKLGVALKQVFIVRRYWSGGVVGKGIAEDKAEIMRPSPGVKDFSHSLRLTEGGAIKAGDIILEQIPKSIFKTEADIRGVNNNPGIEFFYRVGDDLYSVISVVEELFWWNVQLRRLASQEKGRPI